MSSSHPAVACSGLSFAWPDGHPVFTELDVTVASGRTGLVGRNGGGKSTLLRLIAGQLRPGAGTIVRTGEVAYLPQDLTLRTAHTVADLLGVSARVAALRAIETGDADPAQFATLADDWDVEDRARAALERVGFGGGAEVLDRPVATLSGGETVLTGLAGLLLARAPISLLDEPSNNLDRRARTVLEEVIEQWPGVLIVASHDRALLERVEQIVELHRGSARTFGGGWSAYAAAIETEQQAAARQVRAAEGELAREKRQLIETQLKLAQRRRFADKAFREKREPRIAMNAKKRKAQVSAAKYRETSQSRVQGATSSLAEAEDRVRDVNRIRVDLPATAVPAGRDVLRLGDLTVRGAERIALIGPNGAGKTALFRALVGLAPHPRVDVAAPSVPTGYLPQRLDLLDDASSVLDSVRAGAPAATPNEVRAGLARFLVRGDRAEQLVGSLSGGERLRVALARLLLSDPAPQLLLLDEPTNSLDLDSVEQLVSALQNFHGALIVASHDERFLADVGANRRWAVADLRLPVEVQPAGSGADRSGPDG